MKRNRPARLDKNLALAAEASKVLLNAAALLRQCLPTEQAHALSPAQLRRRPATRPGVTAARRLNRAAGILAFSVLADSAVEHYRGSFHNRAMYTPLGVSLLSLALSGYGLADRRESTHLVRDLGYGAAILTGLAGTAFHVYNVGKRPGRFSWENLFYSAPLGAPSAMLLSGIVGFMAERVRRTPPRRVSRFLGLPVGRLTAALTALGLLGTSAEAALLHFRGAYHDPFMYIPITLAPVAAAAMGEVAVGESKRNRALSRWCLRLTAAMGAVGVGFHAIGIHRNMGGWKNWRQNVLNGPPLPAPPSFLGLALAGLAALELLETRPE
ncbi:MAG: hypothetical protein ACREDL_04580 [Bradyrhizobium sp.]